MVYKSSVYVCVFWILLQKLILSIFATFLFFWIFPRLLWESAGCVEGGGKMVHKASATQRRDMHQFPLHPFQLHRSHNLACPLRLMIAEPVSPFASSPSLPHLYSHPQSFPLPYTTAGHTSLIPGFCELCFPFLLTWVCFPSYWPSFFSVFLHPEKSLEVVWLQDGPRMQERLLTPIHSWSPHYWFTIPAHTDNSPQLFCYHPFLQHIPHTATVCLGLLLAAAFGPALLLRIIPNKQLITHVINRGGYCNSGS